MSGGTLDADESLTISGALVQGGNISIDVASGKTLTFSTGEIKTESHQLTLAGGGTIAFPSNASGIVLNNAAGLLKLDGTGTLGAAKVTAVSNAGKGLAVNASSTISSLKVAANTELNVAQGKTLSGSTEVAASTTLNLSGTGTFGSALNLLGTLKAGANLTVSGLISVAGNSTVSIPAAGTTLTYSGGDLNVGSHTLSIGGAGTFSNATGSPLVLDVADSILDLSGSGTITGPVRLEGCTLKASSGTPTISGTLTQYDNATIDVATNQTLNYSGPSLSLGANKLTLTGGGTFNNTNALVLNNADSLLSLSGILTIRDVDGTAASNSGKGIQVTSSATLGDYDLSAVSYLSLAANKTLAGQLNLQTNGELKTSGDGQYIGDIALAGGKFSATDSQVLSGTLSITADSELKVSDNYTLTLSQAGGLSLGANTLTLSGGGTLVSGGLTLNDADSKLLLNSITVDNVSTTSDSLGLDVDGNSTVSTLLIGHITPVSIATGKTLSGAITVSAGSLKLTEAGTLASTIAMSGGTLDADNSLTVSGTLTQSGNITIDVADGKTLTYSGAALSLDNNTLTLSGEGRLSNSNALVLNNASSKLLLSSSITVDNVSTSHASLGLDVDANSTVTSLTVGHTTPVSIVSGRTLSGAITVTAGSIKLDEAGELASTIAMSGGTLDADNSLTLSGALTQSGNITIDVADNKTLTYSGAAISLGANTLTLSGGGTLSNTNALVLNDANSLLSLAGILVMGDVDGTAASNSGKGIQVSSSATLGDYDLSAVSYLSIAANKTLAGQLNLQTNGELKTSGDGQYIGDIALAGGKFSATDNQVLSGTLSITADSELRVSENYTLTLSQTGGLALGANTLTLSGGGSLVSGGLTLDNAAANFC